MKKKLIGTILLALFLITAMVTGCTGDQGLKGLKGDTGAQGIQGIQGEQGVQGEQGLQGIAGAKGSIGATGATGAVGATGEQGLQGLRGYPGATGAAGKDAEFPTPTIDGILSPHEWYSALWFDEMLGNTFLNPSVMSTQIYITNDVENLYIALVLPDTYDMREHPEVAEGGSDTFALNIGVVGEARSYSRVLQFNTAAYPDNPALREGWTPLDGYLALWQVATSTENIDKWGPSWEAYPVPVDVQSATMINNNRRVQEIAIPLSDLGVDSGTLLRIGGCIRAAEYNGYNFHALYPVGLTWGTGATYKIFLVR